MEFKQKNIKFIFLIFAFVFIVIYALCANFLQLKSYNIMNKLTVKNKIASDDVVLIVIDDKSLHEIGRWPWKREYYLEIFDYLEKYTDVSQYGYDGLIMAPDLEHFESDQQFFNNIHKYKKLTAGVAFDFNQFEQGIDGKYYDELLKTKNNIKIIDKRSKKKKTNLFNSFTVLQKQYFKNVPNLGFVNVPEDIDGYVRKASQLIEYKGEFFPSLALQVYSKVTGIDEFILTDNGLFGFSQDTTLKIPTKVEHGFISNYICFYKTKDNVYSHKKYSASDVINSYRAIKRGEKPILDAKEFKNKVVFVGANANAQALTDVIRTPISENFSGLDTQATNFDNLITGNFFVSVNNLYNFFACLFIFVAVFLLVNSLSVAGAMASSICLMFLYLLFAFFTYTNKIAISLMLPELFILVSLGCAYSYKYLIEDTKKIKIQKAMGKYLSVDVMKNVVENIDDISLGGKKADVSVLFADIRNFTSISESMSANEVTEILNEYFSALVPIIEENNGILNKFMGDAVLAIFGAHKQSENHALDAVLCADRMLKKVRFLQEKWMDEGKPKIEIGIGIATGEAFLGNIGSQDRLEYTAIGDTVNTASRIENYNKIYRTNFLISESTYKRVQKYVDAITIKNVTIRGKANRINIYEIVRVINKG